MPVPHRPIPLEMIAEARRLYTETKVPVRDICALLGIGTSTFFKRLERWNWPMRSKRIPTIQPPQPAPDGADAPPLPALDGRAAAIDRARTLRLIAALQELAEKQIGKLGRITGKLGEEREDLPEVQDAMRSGASAMRTLREILVIEHIAAQQSDSGNDEFPRSEDELRSELLRKMDALVAGQSGDLSREPEPG
jgi:hypothetical protein